MKLQLLQVTLVFYLYLFPNSLITILGTGSIVQLVEMTPEVNQKRSTRGWPRGRATGRAAGRGKGSGKV